MVDKSDFPKQMLITPSKIALQMTDVLEAALDDNQIIPNAMNGLSISWASAAGVFSSIVHMIEDEYATLYPTRALTPKQLYPKLSQYDYVNLQASPATLDIFIGLRKDELLASAVQLDDVYDLIVIPKTMRLFIGPITVSLYHDINIKINRNTGVVSVLYDTSTPSPFETLSGNMMKYPPVAFRKDMLDYILFGFTTFQFTRVPYKKTISSQEGFSFIFPFTDYYYAVRVWSLNSDGTYTELTQCYDRRYYNTSTPTAIVEVDNTAQTVTVTIPQVYLESNMVSAKIMVEVFSTKGALTYNIPASDALNIKADFDTKSSVYAAPLEKMSSYILYANQASLLGGSTPKDFDQMKDGVVNQSFYDRIPITQDELDAKAKNSGYTLTEQIDDITNRTYFATNTMYDSDGTSLPVLAGSILLADQSLTGNPDTILLHADMSIMVLPTTLFVLGATGSVCTPVTDEQLNYLKSLTKGDLVTELNTNTYLRQPFHIALTQDKVYPIARPYNLLTPTGTALTYVKENEKSAEQMTVTNVQIQHLADGTGGYEIRLAATLTDSLKSVDKSTLGIAITIPTTTNTRVYLTGSVTQITTDNNVVFSVFVETNYHIDVSDNMTITALDWYGNQSSPLIALSSLAYILLFVPQSDVTSEDQDNQILPNIPPPLRTSLCVAQQSMQLTLGVNMDKTIYSSVNTTWGNDVYKTYLTDTYETTTGPVYQRDSSGNIVVRAIVGADGKPALDYVALYDTGDTVVSELDITTTLDSDIPENTAVLSLTDATGILVGMMITTAGIAYGTTVKSVSGNKVTMTESLVSPLTQGTTIIFSNATRSISLPADQSASALGDLPVGSTTGLYVGQSVYGFDIPAGATVKAIKDSATITLSVPTTKVVTKGTLVTFINKSAPPIVIHAAGSIELDVNGNPIIIKDRQNEYRVPAILFDGRLYESESVSDKAIVSELATDLIDYAAGIAQINFGFAEQREVFYQPTRTIGTATFDTGSAVTRTLGLSFGLTATFYLPEATYGDEETRDSIKATTISEFSAELLKPVISMFDLGKNIAAKLGNEITGVALSGLNNDPTLMVVSLKDTICQPSVRKVLYVKDNGSLDRQADITFIFLASTDGT